MGGADVLSRKAHRFVGIFATTSFTFPFSLTPCIKRHAMESAWSVMFTVVGANHRSSSLSLRDQIAVEDEAVPGFLAALAEVGLSQALSISTCDRVEVWSFDDNPKRVKESAAKLWAARAGLPEAAISGQIYCLTGEEAVKHVFTVAASLDSLVIGEPHVLAQVKSAHEQSRLAGLLGQEMESLLQAAYGAAKRVRSETKIGERPVSIAAAASQITRDLHGDLDRCRALLVGIGEMGELIVESLRAQGLQKLSIAAPRRAAAEAMAKGFDCHVAAFEALPDLLVEADIVVTSLGNREAAIRAPEVEAAIKKRKQRPIFLIDAGIPGDVDPAVGKLENAFLYDLNDLEKVAMAGRAEREQAARAAHGLVEQEAAQFRRGRAERAAVPAIIALRSRFEEEAAKAGAEARGDGERAARLLIARLLHDPTEIMKELAAGNHEELRAAEALLKRLFRLGAGS